jgi:hypothetical protein
MAGVKGKGGPKPQVPFSMKLMEKICERIAQGDNLAQVCDEVGMPSESLVRYWVAQDRDGSFAMYARAKEMQLEWWAEDLLEIADATANDYESVNSARARIDTRKWLMSKLAPKRFGDKVEHSGGVVIRHEDDLRKLDELDKLK